MSKYSEKYPHAKNNQEFVFEPGIIVYFDDLMYCVKCDSQTHFVELTFEVGMCSPECYSLMLGEYLDACRKLQV